MELCVPQTPHHSVLIPRGAAPTHASEVSALTSMAVNWRRSKRHDFLLRQGGAGALSPSRAGGGGETGAIDGIWLIPLQSVLLSLRAR